MFGFYCDDGEDDVLVDLFGPTVHEVVFRDAEEGGGRFSAFEAYDAAGAEIATINDPSSPAFTRLAELACGRGQSVAFFLQV